MSNRLTTKDFIERANKIHNNFFDYSKVVYVNNCTKVVISCPLHEDFLKTPNNHLSGQGCPKCKKGNNVTKISKLQNVFIVKSNKVHNCIYDYSLVSYINNHTKVKIICKHHGVFEQSPKTHTKGSGCPKCANNRTSKALKGNTELFIKRANIAHGEGTYDYSKSVYINSNEKITITCKIHGDFKQRSCAHIRGRGCRQCAFISNGKNKTKSVEIFIKEASEKHECFYDYSNINYIGTRVKVTISCPIHGDFNQTPYNHVQGQGCKKCADERSLGFRRSKFIEKSKNNSCVFYILKCFDENEKFYKIGISTRTIKERYHSTESMPYNYEIISEIYGEAGFIWDLELEEKRKLKKFNYQPLIKFGGSKTECFTQYIVD